jgi:hypothetical protein
VETVTVTSEVKYLENHYAITPALAVRADERLGAAARLAVDQCNANLRFDDFPAPAAVALQHALLP